MDPVVLFPVTQARLLVQVVAVPDGRIVAPTRSPRQKILENRPQRMRRIRLTQSVVAPLLEPTKRPPKAEAAAAATRLAKRH
jgi:hypothetical protein